MFLKEMLAGVLLCTFPAVAYAIDCPDPRHPRLQVRVIHDNSIPNIGYAYIAEDGRSEILWNPSFAVQLGSDLAEFFRYHECAHIQDGHYNLGVNYMHQKFKESRADCIALMAMSADGVLGRSRFEAILSGLIDIQPNETHTHLSGKKRALVIIDDCWEHNDLDVSD